MIYNILTLFPETVRCFFLESIIKRAIEKQIIRINIYNIRDYSKEKHGKVDDYPFGGGKGMLLTPDPVFRAVESLDKKGYMVYMSPQGTLLNQKKVKELANSECITILCGHYEGIDNRVIEHLVDEEISIGDYIITGGEPAAAVLVDAVTRELDETLGSDNSKLEESFDKTGLLEYEQYTRPADYRGWKVPEVLLSGDHSRIREWKIRRRIINTLEKRPDLLNRELLPPEYKKILENIEEEKKNECN